MKQLIMKQLSFSAKFKYFLILRADSFIYYVSMKAIFQSEYNISESLQLD